MFRHLLVTLDGSRSSEAILPYVTDLAKRLNASVTLVRIVSTAGAVHVNPGERGAVGRPRMDAVRRRAETEAHDYLERQAQTLRRFDIAVSTDVRSGDPAVEIVSAAQDLRADTIAMATHSRRGIDRIMLGSVAERVLHLARVPVILLRAD